MMLLAATIVPRDLLASLWAEVSITFLLILLRTYARLRAFHRLFVDDALVALSWILLLCTAIGWQVDYQQLLLWFSTGYPQKLSIPRIGPMANLLWLCGVWSIKFAFLEFFLKLGRNVRRAKTLWWIVFVSTCGGFIISLACFSQACLTGYNALTLASCDNSAPLHIDPAGLWGAAVVDVVTDLLLLILPIHLLWNTQISLRNKLILGAIFSLTVIIMASGIVRNIIVGTSQNVTEFCLWSTLEHAIAIAVACIGSYRALFTKDTDSQRLPTNPNYMEDLTKILSRPGQGKTSEDLLQHSYPRTTTIVHGRNNMHDHVCSFDHSECLLPLKAVRVKQEVIVQPEGVTSAEMV